MAFVFPKFSCLCVAFSPLSSRKIFPFPLANSHSFLNLLSTECIIFNLFYLWGAINGTRGITICPTGSWFGGWKRFGAPHSNLKDEVLFQYPLLIIVLQILYLQTAAEYHRLKQEVGSGGGQNSIAHQHHPGEHRMLEDQASIPWDSQHRDPVSRRWKCEVYHYSSAGEKNFCADMQQDGRALCFGGT